MSEDNKDYFPNDEEGIRQLLLSLKTKTPNYKTQLELSPAMLQAFADRSDLYEFMVDNSALLEDTKIAFNTAKNRVINGNPGETVPALPTINVPAPPVALTVGIVKATRKDIAKMKLADGYTPEIGEDLGIVKTKSTGKPAEEFFPEVRLRTLQNYKIEATFQKRGMSALRFEFRRKGGAWQKSETALASPFVFEIAPANAGEAEQIEIRAIYLNKNTPFGEYSPTYSMVIAP